MRFHLGGGLLALALLAVGCSSSPQVDAASPNPRFEAASSEPESGEGGQGAAEMVEIPGATFRFGASRSQFMGYLHLMTIRVPDMEESLRQRFVTPPREETLPSFRMDLFEVTNQQFLEFLKATDYTPPDDSDAFLSHWRTGRTFPDWAAGFPVVWVSPQDAAAYCQWRGARLPTEMEWEYAARGTDGRVFPWGNSKPDPAETAVFSGDQAEPAGNRPGDVSPFGVYDLGGNVSEWTSSVATHQGRRQFVFRGGSFREAFREMLAYNRRFAPYDHPRNEYTGFRCVADGDR